MALGILPQVFLQGRDGGRAIGRGDARARGRGSAWVKVNVMHAFRLSLVGTVSLVLLGGLSGAVLAQGDPVEATPSAQPQPPPVVGVGGRVELPEFGLALTFPDEWVWAKMGRQDVDSIVDHIAELKGREFATLTRDHFEFDNLELGTRVVATPERDEWCHVVVNPTELTLDELAAEEYRAIQGPYELPGVRQTSILLPAGPAYRLDISLGVGKAYRMDMTYFTLKRNEWAVRLQCGTKGEAPPDGWLPIAETLEFLPEHGSLLESAE